MGVDRMSFQKLAISFNTEKLKAELDGSAHLWDQNPMRRTYENSPHAEMVDIWARYGKDVTDPSAPHVSEWYTNELKEVRRIADELMEYLGGKELGGVLITKLEAGGKILPHIDHGWHAGHYEKYHILVSGGGVFHFEDGDMISQEGECHKFRNDVLHWVTTDTQRISLIVCIRA